MTDAEGSWKPKLMGTHLYTRQTGWWVQSGRITMASFALIVGRVGRFPEPMVILEGLPFSIDDGVPVVASIFFGDLALPLISLVGRGVPETKTMMLYGADQPVTTPKPLPPGYIANGTVLSGTIVYKAN
jgi:hypothetical protein